MNSLGRNESGSTDGRSAEEDRAADSQSGEEEVETKSFRSRSKSRSRSTSSRRRHSYSGSRSRSRASRYRSNRRSRSRSPSRRRYSRSRSRSRSSPSRSRSPQNDARRSSSYGKQDKYHYGSRNKRRDYNSSYDRSPVRRGGRHFGSRDDPGPNKCLGVFGLSFHTQERELRDVFEEYGPIENVQVVFDAQSGRSRGFAFVYFEDIEDAKMARERCNGQEIDGRSVRVDFSITRRAHTPTPGFYMGNRSNSNYRNGGNRDTGYRRRSPYYGNRRRYSRSPSYNDY